MQHYGRSCFGGVYFFHLTVLIFLIIDYKKKLITFHSMSQVCLVLLEELYLSGGFCGYVFAMYNTTVANTNFIISTQILFLSNFWLFIFKRKDFH